LSNNVRGLDIGSTSEDSFDLLGVRGAAASGAASRDHRDGTGLRLAVAHRSDGS
jgi:hypothetical protein